MAEIAIPMTVAQMRLLPLTPIRAIGRLLHSFLEWVLYNAWRSRLTIAFIYAISWGVVTFGAALDWPLPTIVLAGMAGIILPATLDWQGSASATHAEKELTRDRARHILLLKRQAPLLHSVARIATAANDEANRLYNQLIGKVTDMVETLSDAPQARSTFFVYKTGQLVFETSHGRDHAEQRRRFDKTTTDGTQALNLLIGSGSMILYDGLDSSTPPPGWGTDTDKSYCTFASIGIVVGKKKVGMLTLDSAQPDSITETDLALLTTMASLVAAAYSARHCN